VALRVIALFPAAEGLQLCRQKVGRGDDTNAEASLQFGLLCHIYRGSLLAIRKAKYPLFDWHYRPVSFRRSGSGRGARHDWYLPESPGLGGVSEKVA